MNRGNVRRGNFGQMDPADLLTKAALCAQAGKGIDLATGECCEGAGCFMGYTPGGTGTGTGTGIPVPPTGGGGIEIPTGHVLVQQSELEALKADRDKQKARQITVGLVAGLGGLGLGGLLGWALGR